jgi:small subunit ribosomal protein S20
MPHTHSAEKRLRQDEKRRLRNKARVRGIKKQIKVFLDAVKSAPDKAAAEYNLAAGKLDRAAAKRTIHPNAAARKKSQLAKKLAAAKSAKA